MLNHDSKSEGELVGSEYYSKSTQLPDAQKRYLEELQLRDEVLSRAEFDDYVAIIAEEWEPGDHVFRLLELRALLTPEMASIVNRYIRGKDAEALLKPEKYCDILARGRFEDKSKALPVDNLDREITVCNGEWGRELLKRIRVDGEQAVASIRFSDVEHDFLYKGSSGNHDDKVGRTNGAQLPF